jgi:hypothetical protein
MSGWAVFESYGDGFDLELKMVLLTLGFMRYELEIQCNGRPCSMIAYSKFVRPHCSYYNSSCPTKGHDMTVDGLITRQGLRSTIKIGNDYACAF